MPSPIPSVTLAIAKLVRISYKMPLKCSTLQPAILFRITLVLVHFLLNLSFFNRNMKIYAALALLLASSAVAAPYGGEDGHKNDHQKKVTVTDYKYKTEYV